MLKSSSHSWPISTASIWAAFPANGVYTDSPPTLRPKSQRLGSRHIRLKPRYSPSAPMKLVSRPMSVVRPKVSLLQMYPEMARCSRSVVPVGPP